MANMTKTNKVAQPFKGPKGGKSPSHGSHGHKPMPGKKTTCC